MGKIYCDGGLVKSYEFGLQRAKDGLWTCSQVYYCLRTELEEVVPKQGDPHPDYKFLHLDTLDVVGMEGNEEENLCKINANYAGASALGQDDEEEVNPPEYALDLSLSEEPLETLPRYVDSLSVDDIAEAMELATNPPTNDDGTLKTVDTTGWPALKLELYNKRRRGVEAYRDPKATWTMRWVSEEEPQDLNKVGEIAEPPGPVPPVKEGWNWLNTGLRSTQKGLIYECEQVFELSGRGGWDPDIYA